MRSPRQGARVETRSEQRGLFVLHGRVQESQALVARETEHPVATHAGGIGNAQVRCQTTALRPEAPRDRRRGKPLRSTLRRQRVQNRVRRRVVRLPGTSSTPDADENKTNALRAMCRVNSSRYNAASTFEAKTRSIRSALCDSSTASSSMPAVWITALRGCSASIDASSPSSSERWLTSHTATRTLAPSAVNSRCRASPPPRREHSTR